jgi:hypothetical protein
MPHRRPGVNYFSQNPPPVVTFFGSHASVSVEKSRRPKLAVKEESSVDPSTIDLQAVTIAAALAFAVGGLLGIGVTYFSCRAAARIREQLRRAPAASLWRDGWSR